jgi:ribonucleoside-diphosphate reductase beta chain
MYQPTSLLQKKMGEPILQRENNRFCLFPIQHNDLWERYETALASFWVAGEVDLGEDKKDWKKLNDKEKHFITHVLAFFASADGIVCDNLDENFGSEVQYREAKMFYDLQKTIENIHNQMYSLLIQTLIETEKERERVFNAIQTIPCVQKKAEWAKKWMDGEKNSFQERLIAFSVVEGIFFSGSFCAIFWLKKRNLLPGLCASNILIARDEGMHQEFACHLYKNHIKNKLPERTVHDIVDEAVQHETEFICDAIPVSMIGMSSEDMTSYIKFVADSLLVQLGVSKFYFEENPFDWMATIGMSQKTNFFEHRSLEYQKVGAKKIEYEFSTGEDF